MQEQLTRLTKELLDQFTAIFLRHPRYSVSDRAIRMVMDAMPKNTTLPEVVAKVSVIKTLYATPIYDVYSICERIVHVPTFDLLLERGDLEAVKIVRSGHGIRMKKTNKELDFYSFATKYCSFHNPREYPIYDNLVADLLWTLNKEHKWTHNLYKYSLLDYGQFKTLLDTCAQFYSLGVESYKTLDQGLWIFAKYKWLLSNKPRAKDDEWLLGEVEKLNH